MPVPQYRSANAAFVAGTGSITVTVPADYVVGDLLLLLVNTANQPISAPSGWTQVANSPQSTGSAGSAGGVSIQAFWKLAGSGEASVSLPDAGSYIAARMFAFYDVDVNGPIHVTAGSVLATAASGYWYLPSVTTTLYNCLIVQCIGIDRDTASDNEVLANWVPGNTTRLPALIEREDQTVSSGVGGGIGMATGQSTYPGDIGSTRVTSSEVCTAAFLTIALGSTPTTYSAEATETAVAGNIDAGGIPYGASIDSSAAIAETLSSDPKVEIVGLYSFECPSYQGSVSITVPGDTSLCLAFLCGHNGYNPDLTFTESAINIYLDGQEMSFEGRSTTVSTAEGDLALLTMVSPPTGTYSISWSLGTTTSPFLIGLIYLKNVDPETPILSMVSGYTISGGSISLSGLTTSQQGMVIGGCSSVYSSTVITSEGQELLITKSPGFGDTKLNIAKRPTLDGDFKVATTYNASAIAISLKPGEISAPPPVQASCDEGNEIVDTLAGILPQIGVIDQEQFLIDNWISGNILLEDITETAAAGAVQITGAVPALTGAAYTYLCPDSTTTTFSQTVTVPAGTTFVLAYMQARRNPPGNLNEPTLGGKAFSSIGYGPIKLVCFENWKMLKDPTIGGQTLAWTDNSAYCAFIVLLFYKDVDPDNPILDVVFDAPVFGDEETAFLTDFTYDPIGVTLGFCYPTIVTLDSEGYDTAQTVLATCDNFDTAYGHGVVVAPTYENLSRIYTTNYGGGMSISVVTLAGNIAGPNTVSVHREDAATPGHTQSAATPDGNVDEYVDLLALAGPYATVNSATPLLIPTTAGENLNYPITIPEGTDVIIAFFNGSNYLILTDTYTHFYLNGAPFTRVTATSANASGTAAVGAWAFVSPPAGEQIFGWSCDDINTSTYFMVTLVFIKGVDISTYPVVSFGHANAGAAGAPVQITGLMHSPGDLVIGFVNSEMEIPTSSDVPDMETFPPPPSTLVHYGRVQRVPPFWSGSYGSVCISMGESTDFVVAPDPGAKLSGVALCLRCDLNGATWIDPSSNTTGEVLEASGATSWEYVPALIDESSEDSVATEDLIGNFVDLVGGITSPSGRLCYSSQINSSSESTALIWTGDDPDLLVVVICSMAELGGPFTAPWLADGEYTLTQNGVQATHYSLSAALATFDGVNHLSLSTLIAYVPNPTSGMLQIGINNPHYGAYNEYEPSVDLIVAFLVKHADVSGGPFRGTAGPTVTSFNDTGASVSEVTLSGISFTQGDMVVGIAITVDDLGLGTVGPYDLIGGEFTRDMVGPLVDWAYALQVGGAKIGGDSSITFKTHDGNQTRTILSALVIKGDMVEGVISPTQSGARADSLEASDSFTGSLALSDFAVESWAATESSTRSAITPGVITDSAMLIDASTGDATGEAAIALALVTLSAAEESAAVRTAAAFFGRMDVIDVSDTISTWEIGYAGVEESVLPGEAQEGFRLVYDDIAEGGLAMGDLLTAERFVEGIAAELCVGGDEPVATMVCWDFVADTSMVLDISAAVADVYPSVFEISTIVDGYSAILILCYFPEMTVTYNREVYSARLEVPALAASLVKEEIAATYTGAGVAASFTGQEITAKYEPITITASKGE